MQSIQQCHRAFLPVNGESVRGTVHSVFSSTSNILLENAQLITLSPKEQGKGPAAFIPSEGVPKGLTVGQSVTLSSKELRIADMRFPIEAQAPYDLQRGSLSIESATLEHLILWLRGKIVTAAAERIPDAAFFRSVSEKLAASLESLKRLLLSEDRSKAVEAGRSLIGLGMGLTPSGDDMLTGMFFVLGLEGSPFPDGDSLLCELIRGCKELTTDVSWQMLSAAAKGYYKEILTDFAAAFSANDSVLDAAAETILSVGHSSGADMLTGILAGLEILQAIINNTGE